MWCTVVAVVDMVAVEGTITEMVVAMDPIETRVVVRVHDHTENSQCYYYDCPLWENISIPVLRTCTLIQAHKVGCLLSLLDFVKLSYTSLGRMFVCPKVIDLCYMNFCIEADGCKLQMLVGLRCYFRWVLNCYDCLPYISVFLCLSNAYIPHGTSAGGSLL